MSTQKHIIPAAAVRGIATGLLLMAFFTSVWAGIAFVGLRGTSFAMVLSVFAVLAVAFIFNAIKLFSIAGRYPALTDEADIARQKSTGKWFGIIFGAEGLLIFIGINVVTNLGYPELSVPVIALVVALHFFPLAKVFNRKVDYYIGSWSLIIAVCAIVFTLEHTLSDAMVFAFTGIGIALATSAYGVYMMLRGWKMPSPL